MKRFAIALLAGAAFSANAFADDLASETVDDIASASPAFDWTGVYFGAHGGYGWADFENNQVEDFGAPVDLPGVSADGGLGGVHLGLNRQWGKLVVGGELSASIADIEGSVGCDPDDFSADSICSNSLDWLALGLGRIGWVQGNWHVYGQGGVAIAGFTGGAVDSDGAPPEGFYRGTTTTIGGAAGFGFEHRIAPGVVAGVDYLHVFSGSARTLAVDNIYESLNTELEDVDIVRARLGVLWGGPDSFTSTYGSGFASAADGPWTGVYFGAHGGYGWADFENNQVQDFGAPVDLPGIAADGGLGGVHLGLNRQWGKLVVGGELSASIADIEGSVGCNPDDFTADSICSNSLDWLALGLGRIGWAQGNWHVYGQGGVAIAGFTGGAVDSNVNFFPEGFYRGTTTTIGGAAGFGIEHRIAPGVVAGVDYLHVFSGSARTLAVDNFYESLNTELEDVDIVRARLGVLWGGPDSFTSTYGSGFASAADGPWSGVYFGAHGGYGWADFENNQVQDIGAPFDLPGIAADGGLGGVHLGLNRQWGKLVVGGELSASIADVEGTVGCSPAIFFSSDSTCSNSLDWLALGLGRIGWAQGNWHVYGQGGVAIAGFTGGAVDSNVNFFPEGFYRGTTTTIGGAAGFGFEHRIAPGVVAGVDYLHVFSGSARTVAVDEQFRSLNTELENMDIVRARISWHWGGR